MNIRDRLAFALMTKAGPLRASLLPSWERGRPVPVETDFKSLVTRGYHRNELIYACLNKNAAAAASISLQVRKKSTGELLPEHPIKLLVQRPNLYMNEYDLWASVRVTQKVAAVAYYEMEMTRGSEVIGLWPLRPDRVRPVLDDGVTIKYYEYTIPGTPPVQIDPATILSFPIWDPLGTFTLWPPVATAMRVGSVHNMTTDYMDLFFRKGAAPPGLLSLKSRSTEERIDQLRAAWRRRYAGYESWIDPAILDVEATFQRIGFTFAEMGIDVLDNRNETLICAVLDVPPIIVGASAGLDRSTFSNYIEARASWWEDSLVPSFENMLDTLQNQLPESMTNDVILEWDLSKVPAMQEQQISRSKHYMDAWNNGLITRNEWRTRAGFDATPDGDTFKTTPQPVASPEAVKIIEGIFQRALPTGHDHDHKADWESDEPPGSKTRDAIMGTVEDRVAASLERQKLAAIEAVSEVASVRS